MDKRLYYTFLVILVLVTFFLRLNWLGYASIEGDTFRDLAIAHNMSSGSIVFNGGILDRPGALETQTTFGPFNYYLYSFLMKISSSLLLQLGFLAFINCIAVIFTFFLCKKFIFASFDR